MSSAVQRSPAPVDRETKRPSDEQLLLRYRDKGDRAAFEELVHRYERDLYSYLRRYVRDASLAEDVFQATFLQLHQKCHMYQEGKPLRPWLYTIATNQAVDALRKAGRHQAVSLDMRQAGAEVDGAALISLLEQEEPGPVAELEEKEKRVWMRDCVDQLPDHLRSVILLTYYQGLKYREVAEILNIPVGTMKSRLHTALVRLHEAWKRRQDATDR